MEGSVSRFLTFLVRSVASKNVMTKFRTLYGMKNNCNFSYLAFLLKGIKSHCLAAMSAPQSTSVSTVAIFP